MTIKPRSVTDLNNLYGLIVDFLEVFEKLYVGDDPDKISRCRLCIFQLIHVPQHIHWNGSVRLGSQATVERAIGEVGRKIRSKKAPFAHLANILHEREMVKLLALQIPSLTASKPIRPSATRPFSRIRISKKEQKTSTQLKDHLESMQNFLQFDMTDILVERWGKVSLYGRANLYSQLFESRGDPPARSTRYFEVNIYVNHFNFLTKVFIIQRPILLIARVSQNLGKLWLSTLFILQQPTKNFLLSITPLLKHAKYFEDGKELGQILFAQPESLQFMQSWEFGMEPKQIKCIFFASIQV